MTEAEKREKIQVIHYCSYCGDNKIKEYNDKELNYFYCETCGKTQDYEVQKGKPPRRIITKISLILMIFGMLLLAISTILFLTYDFYSPLAEYEIPIGTFKTYTTVAVIGVGLFMSGCIIHIAHKK